MPVICPDPVPGLRRCLALLLLLVSCVSAGAGPTGDTEGSAAARDADPHAEAARLLISGDAAAAEAIYGELLQRDRADELAAVGLVRAMLVQDRFEKALAEARNLHARSAGSAAVGGALSEALFRAGRFLEAEPLLERLATEEQPPARALLILGRLRAAQGRGAEARELVKRAVDAAPADRELIYRAAGLIGGREESIGLLTRYLELSSGDDPDRIEAARGSLRMLKELGDRRLWVLRSRPEHLELPLRRLTGASGLPVGYVVKVRLGGKKKPVPLLLDTGSSGLFLLERVARKRNFQRLADETVFGGGGGQRHRSPRGLFSEMALGDLVFSDVTATTTRHELDPKGRFHGILGIGAFDGYRVTLDLKRSVLVLDSREAEGAGEGAPYWMLAGHMLVSATANDDTRALFLFDTGATSTYLANRFAESLKGARLAGPAAIQGYGGQRQGSRFVRRVTIEFEGLDTPAGPLSTVDLSIRNRLLGVEISGYLGLDLLDGARIVIDTRTRRVQVFP